MQPAMRQNVPQQMPNFGGGIQTQMLQNGANPALIQAMTTPNLHRQLGLLGVARNQQPQNGPAAAMNIRPGILQGLVNPGQPGMARPPFQPGMFPGQNADSSQQVPPNNAQQQLQALMMDFAKGPNGQMLPFAIIKQKMETLKNEIEQQRRQIVQMSQSPNTNIIPIIRTQQQQLQIKEALFARVQQILLQSTAQQQQQQQQQQQHQGGDGGGDPSNPK
jgi:hypothetical protein